MSLHVLPVFGVRLTGEFKLAIGVNVPVKPALFVALHGYSDVITQLHPFLLANAKCARLQKLRDAGKDTKALLAPVDLMLLPTIP